MGLHLFVLGHIVTGSGYRRAENTQGLLHYPFDGVRKDRTFVWRSSPTPSGHRSL